MQSHSHPLLMVHDVRVMYAYTFIRHTTLCLPDLKILCTLAQYFLVNGTNNPSHLSSSPHFPLIGNLRYFLSNVTSQYPGADPERVGMHAVRDVYVYASLASYSRYLIVKVPSKL